MHAKESNRYALYMHEHAEKPLNLLNNLKMWIHDFYDRAAYMNTILTFRISLKTCLYI